MRGLKDMMDSGLVGMAVPSAEESSAPVFITAAPQRDLARFVRAEISSRAARVKLFRETLFSDPAWDMLLDLFAAEYDGRRVKVTGIGAPARIPATTALRWLSALEAEGLVARRDDPLDRRRVILNLTPKARQLMTLYFERKLHLSIQADAAFATKC